MKNENLKITAAACIDNHGKVWSLPKPYRHHDVLAYMHTNGIRETTSAFKQGFKCSDGNFIDRRGALYIAKNAGQMKPRKPGEYDGDELFSEDVW
jgi:hypothetical protein